MYNRTSYDIINTIMVGLKINKTLRNVIIAILVVAALVVITSLIPNNDFSEKYEGYDLTTSVGVQSASKTYAEYQLEHKSAKNGSVTVEVDVFNFDEELSSGTHVENDYYGKNVVVTDDRSSVTWFVDVPEQGLYNIELEYIAIPSRNIEMERILYINDEVPFSGADILTFQRLWKDGEEVKYDNQGNCIRPTQIESFEFQKVLLKSDLGYEVDPYVFFFKKGENKITFESTNEPMAINALRLVPVNKIDSYEQYLTKQKSKPENYTSTGIQVKIQGEDSIVRAMLTGNPFLWHIYPQEENAHFDKINALFDRMDEFCSDKESVKILRQLTLSYNGNSDFIHNFDLSSFIEKWKKLSEEWRDYLLSLGSLTDNLLAFIREKNQFS